jgi:hypothetical protein
MLSLRRNSIRVKAAAVAAATYAFCVLLPATAFSLADGRMAPPCLVEDLVAVATHDHDAAPSDVQAHHHHDGMHAAMHHPGTASDTAPPADRDQGKGRPGECCGLFPLLAFADGLPGVPAPSRLASILIPLMTNAMIGRGPDRIIRPPIA